MKVKVILFVLLTGLSAEAAAQPSEFAIGRGYFTEGELKPAIAHFQLAVQVNPSDADAYYWLGRSYELLADIGFPFSGKYTAKARACLTKAAQLSPDRADYRKELFNFLLDPVGSSRASIRQAAAILESVASNDPDYEIMQRQFERECKANGSTDAWMGKVFLALPRAAYRIAEIAPAKGPAE